jgi:DNA-binding CsgD family transcriptional regulator
MTATIGEIPEVPNAYRVWLAAAFLLGTIARDTVADAPRYTGGQALTHGETRVLHYLPTNLSAREIAGELYLSVNTIKTHQRHLYAKLGARSRTQAVEQARALGLLAPSFRGRPATSGSATSGSATSGDGLVRTLEPRTVRRNF